MRVQMSKTLGRYDLCSNDKDWQVVVRVFGPDKALSVMFPEDREPDVRDLPPSEVVELIADRFQQYMYRSNAAKDDATMAWMREHAEALDHAWASGRVREILAEIANLSREASDLMKAYPAPSLAEEAAHA